MKPYNGFTEQQRNKAQRWINAQIDAGLLAKPSKCCACGQKDGPMDYHAEDYNEPFGSHITKYPMCYICHMLLHCRKATVAWKRYLKLLRDGARFVAFRGRNWDGIKRFIDGGELHWNPGPPRPTLIFDTMFDEQPRPRPVPEPPKQLGLMDWGIQHRHD